MKKFKGFNFREKTWIKLISLLFYIKGIIITLMGIFGMVFVFNNSDFFKAGGVYELFIIFSVVYIALGITAFFAGRGIWKGQRWSRIASVILLFFAILVYINIYSTNSVASVLGILLSVLVMAYLLFSQTAREHFKKVAKGLTLVR